jgi:ankyrin repeat protein
METASDAMRQSLTRRVFTALFRPRGNMNDLTARRTISMRRTSRGLLLIVFFSPPLLLFAQPQSDVNRRDHFGVTELMRAACDPVRIKALLESGVDVNLASDTGWTALLGAAMGGTLVDKTPPGCVDAAQELIAAGANLNAKETLSGRTPLIYATLWRRTQVAEVLIKAGADLNIALPESGETALILAALSGQAELVQALISARAIVNQREKDGATALTLAAWNCHPEIVKALMQAGARPESTAWRELRQPEFEDFSVSAVYKGPHAPVSLRSNPEGENYRTRLREGAKKPPNFAGHYVLVEWGCGTECTVYMMIDVKNGRVFSGPQAMSGGIFRLNSSLFMANADTNDSYASRFFHWNNGRFNLIYQQGCKTVDGQQECGCKDTQRMLFPMPIREKSR